jgi:uncharacterized Zn finger protein
VGAGENMEIGINCVKCKSRALTLIEVINPDTTEMNMNAILECGSCGHRDTYEVTSYYSNERRNKGFTR